MSALQVWFGSYGFVQIVSFPLLCSIYAQFDSSGYIRVAAVIHSDSVPVIGSHVEKMVFLKIEWHEVIFTSLLDKVEGFFYLLDYLIFVGDKYVIERVHLLMILISSYLNCEIYFREVKEWHSL